MLFKLDLEKAYDRVDWSFLEGTLRDFGFPVPIIGLIMHCVSSSSLSLIWNGVRLPAFSATRGLHKAILFLLICLCFVWSDWLI